MLLKKARLIPQFGSSIPPLLTGAFCQIENILVNTVYLCSNHCERRELDLGRLRIYLCANGWRSVETMDDASLIVFMACGMTVEASTDLLDRLASARRTGCRIVLFGCYSAMCEHRTYPDVDYVSLSDVEQLDQVMNATCSYRLFPHPRCRQAELTSTEVLKRPDPRLALPSCGDVFSLLVSEGCSGQCSYCSIRRATGPQRSRSIHDVMDDLRSGLSEGFRVFRFQCENLGLYGLDIGTDLGALLREMAGIHFEYSVDLPDLHPSGFVSHFGDIMEFAKRQNVYLMHLPVQSASERILKLMNRRYPIEEVSSKLAAFRERFPDVRVGTDIIAGFPTESEADFASSYRFMKTHSFDWIYLHGFVLKKGTPAERLTPRVPADVITNRIEMAYTTIPRIACFVNKYEMVS